MNRKVLSTSAARGGSPSYNNAVSGSAHYVRFTEARRSVRLGW